MKILDRYLLKSFLITFTTVFVILFFIFVLQVVWLFISELAGKDLDIIMIVKFLMFKMPSIIPLVLPLSVLLASIMTFGSLAENYEFAAIKSSGISLQRAMRSIIYFIAILSVVAFFFANNVIPFAEYKFINFRRDIAQVKPAMAITEGQFSEVGNYNIKVEKKSGENGKYLDRITIHQKSTVTAGSNTVIKAKKGELISSKNSNVLKLVLKDGNYYEDIIPKKFEDRSKLPFAKSEFKRYVINIDLSKLSGATADNEKITNTNTMLTIGELRYTLDSLQNSYNKDVASTAENISQRFTTPTVGTTIPESAPKINASNILQDFSNSDKSQILRVASSSIEAANFSLENTRFDLEEKQKNINQHWIALYDKFVIAYACLLMFFIGAPLGAIIRKGGLGLPIVFAILIFIIFHFINTFGKKVAQENGLTPFMGCWMSSFVLTPLAIFLTKTATDDKGFSISFDRITTIFNYLFPPKKEDESDDTETLERNEELSIMEVDYCNTINKQDVDFDRVTKLNHHYKIYSTIALVSYLLLLGLTIALGKPTGLPTLLPTLLVAIVFYITLFISQQLLNKISAVVGNKTDLNTYTVILAGYPFFILFYFYNRSHIKEVLAALNKISDGQY